MFINILEAPNKKNYLFVIKMIFTIVVYEYVSFVLPVKSLNLAFLSLDVSKKIYYSESSNFNYIMSSNC